MAAAGRNDWQRSRPPHIQYSNSYDSYYGGPEAPPSSYPPGYGTPRGGPPPPHHSSHPQHSPMISRNSEPDHYYHERPLSPGFGPPPPHHSYGGQPYERQPPPPLESTPYRGRGPPPSHSSQRPQMVHRGTPPYSSRGGSVAGASTPRSHPTPQRYVDARHPGGPPSSFFPESPFSARSRGTPPGPPSGPPSGPRSRMMMPLHRQHLPPVPRNAGPAPWEPPSPNSELQRKPSKEHEEPELENQASRESSEAEEEEDNGGDPLALLAKVSSDMETKPGSKAKRKGKKHASSAPPCSPLRRTTRTSPVITPTTDNTSTHKRKAEVQIDPSFPEVPPPPRGSALPMQGPKAVTPMPGYFPQYGEDPRAPPHHHYGGPPPSGYHPYPPHRTGSMPWHHHDQDPHHPAVVGHSFDSHDSRESYESSRPPHRSYYGQPPPTHSSYGPPPQQEWSRGPPTPGPPTMSGPPPPSMYPMRYTYNGPPPPPRSSDPYGMSPYSYAQQPQHLEEKTVLRRKFSWKHYPELERFLIAHRDDYLEHSSKNYTAEQKQYNNWLTEQLLAVAEQHSYIFDPEDFNFVSIRDRIRCYYKSYVQTARKRGLELPGKAHIKKHRPANSLDKYAEEKDKRLREQHGDDDDESEEDEARNNSKSKGEETGSKPSSEEVKKS